MKCSSILLGTIGFLALSASLANPENDTQTLPKHFARCTATKKIVCGDGECNSAAPTVFVLLGSQGERKTYSRCDQQGCDTYDATVKEAGIYENWQLTEPQGMIFKRALSDGTFVEVATLGMEVYISTGRCEISKEFVDSFR